MPGCIEGSNQRETPNHQNTKKGFQQGKFDRSGKRKKGARAGAAAANSEKSFSWCFRDLAVWSKAIAVSASFMPGASCHFTCQAEAVKRIAARKDRMSGTFGQDVSTTWPRRGWSEHNPVTSFPRPNPGEALGRHGTRRAPGRDESQTSPFLRLPEREFDSSAPHPGIAKVCPAERVVKIIGEGSVKQISHMTLGTNRQPIIRTEVLP